MFYNTKNAQTVINACEQAADNLWAAVENGCRQEADKAESLFLLKLGDLETALADAVNGRVEDFEAIAAKVHLYQNWHSYISGAII